MDWLIITLGFLLLLAIMMWRWVWKARRAVNVLVANERLSQGHCPACGYDLAGCTLKDPQCPECGYTFSDCELKRLTNIAPYLLRTRDSQR